MPAEMEMVVSIPRWRWLVAIALWHVAVRLDQAGIREALARWVVDGMKVHAA